MYPKEFIILFVQSTIACFLIYLSLGQIRDTTAFIRTAATFKNHDEMFSIVNTTDYDLFQQKSQSDSAYAALLGSYRDIKSHDAFKVFQHTEVIFDLERVRNDNRFINGVSFVLINENDVEFNHYALRVGSLFSQRQFSENQAIIPIILGSALTQFYAQDEVFTQDALQFKVIGFLEQGQQSRGIENGFYATVMDYKALVPIDPLVNQMMLSNPKISNPFKVGYLEALLTGMGIYSYASRDIARDFVSHAIEKTHLFDLKLKDINEKATMIYNQQLQAIIGNLVLSITIVVFSGLGIIVGLNSNILKRKKYYAIHYLVGATQLDSYAMIVYQVFVTLISSVCCAWILILVATEHFDGASFLWLVLWVLGYCLVVVVSPIRTLSSMDLNSVIGGERV